MDSEQSEDDAFAARVNNAWRLAGRCALVSREMTRHAPSGALLRFVTMLLSENIEDEDELGDAASAVGGATYTDALILTAGLVAADVARESSEASLDVSQALRAVLGRQASQLDASERHRRVSRLTQHVHSARAAAAATVHVDTIDAASLRRAHDSGAHVAYACRAWRTMPGDGHAQAIMRALHAVASCAASDVMPQPAPGPIHAPEVWDCTPSARATLLVDAVAGRLDLAESLRQTVSTAGSDTVVATAAAACLGNPPLAALRDSPAEDGDAGRKSLDYSES